MLRVISGDARGHKLKTIKGNTTRPTSDRVKENLFNIIAGYITKAQVLDLFAGTGSLGIEALSRGASSAVFVDFSRECASIIKDNLVHTKFLEKSEIINNEVKFAIQKLFDSGKKFDIIFMDPPYNKNFVEETLNYLSNSDIMLDDGIIVAEHDIEDIMIEQIGNLKIFRSQKYGDTVLSFYNKI
ncbi:MAG: 16S rRNA (guanine(966)-N(2))-methyltransferase RsmD [Bacillota bacterium]|nr:16S rRNA (guanine(966)-N(2))-methyltransferase RsmD [Bacillota bacterium]